MMIIGRNFGIVGVSICLMLPDHILDSDMDTSGRKFSTRVESPLMLMICMRIMIILSSCILIRARYVFLLLSSEFHGRKSTINLNSTAVKVR